MTEHREDKTELPKQKEAVFDWDSVGMDFGDWDERKVWALQEPITEMDIKELLWPFDVPFWQKDNADRWTITPWDVIYKAQGSEKEQKRVAEADLSYPIDIMENKGRWFVLDGLVPVQHLFNNNDINANCIIAKLDSRKRSQFFHNLRHFSSQAKDLSTTHRLGMTLKVCNSLLLTTSTVAPMISLTA